MSIVIVIVTIIIMIIILANTNNIFRLLYSEDLLGRDDGEEDVEVGTAHFLFTKIIIINIIIIWRGVSSGPLLPQLTITAQLSLHCH